MFIFIISINIISSFNFQNITSDQGKDFNFGDAETIITIANQTIINNFDQSLNTTDNVQFVNLTLTGNLSLGQKIVFTFGEMINNLVDGWIRITGNLNVTGNTNVVGNITTEEYYFGQPIRGAVQTGLIYALELSSTNTLNVTHDHTNSPGNITYTNGTYRIVVNEVEKYCKIVSATVTPPDNATSIYYIDDNCAVQRTTWLDYKTTSKLFSPWFIALVKHSGVIEFHYETTLLRELTRKDDNIYFTFESLRIEQGFAFTEQEYSNFTIGSGSYQFVRDISTTTEQNTSDGDEVEVTAYAGGNSVFKDISGLDLTNCDNGTGFVACATTTKYRRTLIGIVGQQINGDDTSKIHQIIPLDSETFNNIGDCQNLVDTPLSDSFTKPSFYAPVFVNLYMYCYQPNDVDWDGVFIDLRFASGGGTGGASIDTSQFVLRDGTTALTDNWDVGNFNITLDSLFTSGKVGIGTSDPRVKLEVSETGGGRLMLRNPSETVNAASNLMFSTGSGDFSTTNTMVFLRGDITQATPSSLKGRLRFFINRGDTFGDPVMTMDSDGKVGIGTSTPSHDLVIGHDVGIVTGVAENKVLVVGSASGDALVILGKDTDNWVAMHYDTSADSMFLNTKTDGTFYETMVLKEGNVGIGTTTPDNKLHIINETSITSNDIIQYPLKIEAKDDAGNFWQRQGVGIQFENTASSGSFISAEIIGRTTANAGTDGELLFKTRNSDALGTRMIIENGGNVGIGTDSPAYKIEVDGTFDFYDGTSRITSTNNANVLYALGLRRSAGSGNNPDLYGVSDGLVLGASLTDTSQLVLDSTGNVGIGTNSPTHKLNVVGSLNITGSFSSDSLQGSYIFGEAFVCVYDNGTIFAKEGACS